MLLLIEADILPDREVVHRIATERRDYSFLYNETDPKHPQAYERKRTMSMLLQERTVRHLARVFDFVHDDVLRSLVHCDPSFIRHLIGLRPHGAIRLLHQTHASREVPRLGIAHKANSKASEDADHIFHRQLGISLADRLRPFLDGIRVNDIVERLHAAKVDRVAIFGATSCTLAMQDQIQSTKEIVVVIDSRQSRYLSHFCGKQLLSMDDFRQAHQELGVGAVLVVADPEDEHLFVSECVQLFDLGLVIWAIRQPLPFKDATDAGIFALLADATKGLGYFRRLFAVLMSKRGLSADRIAEVIDSSPAEVMRWVALYDQRGIEALNYWAIA